MDEKQPFLIFTDVPTYPKIQVSKKQEAARIKLCRDYGPTPELDAREVLRLANENNASLGWSGGKCSTVVLYMALQINPDFKVNFTDTGVEYPETTKYVKYLIEEWGINCTINKPKDNYWRIVKEHGFPAIRMGKEKKDKPACCKILKEDPLRNYMQKNNLTGLVTGMRAAESMARTFTVSKRGQIYKTLNGITNYHPIAFWTHDDVWNHILENKIPLNPVYTKQERCGCWPCTGFLDWKETLAYSHPALYRALCKIKGEPVLWEYEEKTDCVEQMVSRETEEMPILP